MTPASTRSNNKTTTNKPGQDMQPLQNFFSPSQSKKAMAGKQNDKNNTTAAVVSTNNRRGKRQKRATGDGSSKAPLQPIDDNDDDGVQKRVKNKRKSTSNEKEEEGSIGLYRIGSWENESSFSLTAPKKHIHILRAGSILGRNISGGRRSSSSNKKLDLGIPLSAGGVSRKQLHILSVSPESITIRQDKPPNSVGVYHYDAESKKMHPTVYFLGDDETTTLIPGDVIEFDNYNRGTERLVPPQHVFRVVTVAPTIATIEEEDSECEIVEPVQKKKKRQEIIVPATSEATTSPSEAPMEIDSEEKSSSNTKDAEVFVDSIASPAEEDSFHTAPESQSSNTTTSLPSPPRLQNGRKVAILNANTAMNEGAQAKQPTAVQLEQEEKTDDAVNGSKPNDEAAQTPSEPSNGPDDGNAPSANSVTFSEKQAAPTVQIEQEKTDEASSTEQEEESAPSKEKETEAEPDETKMAAAESTNDDAAMVDKDDVSPATTPIVRAPKVGDRFRAVYDREKEVTDNFLGFSRPSWYFGTATKVKRKGRSRKMWSIDVVFDDKSTDTIEYPTADSQILTVEGDEAFVEMEDGSRVVAYEGTLTDLAVGDLVDGRYQAGAENGSWFRGRVASVNSAAGTCDVAYFDKEYERNIPIARTNLCRLERGRANPIWLESLAVPGGGRIVKLGEVDNGSSPNHALVLKLKFSGGRFESRTYAEVVPKVFEQVLKSTSKLKRKVWPAVPEVIPKVKTFPVQRRRERREEEMKRYADVESDDEYQPAAAVENQGDLQEEATTEITVPSSNEIPAAICTTFLGAVRSTQPEAGVEFLSQLLTSFNSIPTAAPTKTLYQIALSGPKHDGTYYPDPHKSELVTNYLIGACNRNEEMRKRLNGLTMSSWENVEEVLVQVAEKIYRRDGDERSSSNDALSRITNSLQVVANGLQLMLNLVEYQLTPLIEEADGAGQLRDQPFVKALRDNDGGIRESLKFVVRMTAHAWSTFGHFIAGDMKKLYAHEPRPSQANIQCCKKQVRRVLDSFGRLTSYAAWVYAADEDMRIDTKKFASVIVDVLNSELSQSKVDVDPFAAKKEKMKKAALNKYSEKVKLEFALSLVFGDEEFAAPLQLKVAEVLGLYKKHSFLFDL